MEWFRAKYAEVRPGIIQKVCCTLMGFQGMGNPIEIWIDPTP
jgi:hypothetical protein